MAKYIKGYIDTDVLTEAKKRIKHIINTFDKIYVCFSGGKDSLAVLHLTQEVYDELGITEKINVIFRDEEVIPDEVINFVTSYYESGRYNFYYYCVPLKSTKFILGKTYEYIQWDPNREWVRQKPPFAITLEEGDNRIFDQYTMDAFCVAGVNGKIAFLTGIRADESLVRLASCLNKKNENYICATEANNVKLCKPIFDWSQNDVFKYFYDRGIQYCTIYDNQTFNGDALRVATPLHAECSKRIGKLRTLYPEFYERIINVFPEVILQDKYWDSLDRFGICWSYEHTFDGIMRYIDEHITDPKQKRLAAQRVATVYTTRVNKMKTEQGKRNYGGYPVLYVFKQIINGNFKRAIQPCVNPTKQMLEYENSK